MEREGLARFANWGLRLGRGVFGVPVKVHWTLLVFPIFNYLLQVSQYRTLERESHLNLDVPHKFLLLYNLFAIIVAIVFVYLHELGHAFAAIRTRMHVPEIMLHPLGGWANMGMPMRSPRQDLLISAMGPLVSLFCLGVVALLYFPPLQIGVRMDAYFDSGLPSAVVWVAVFVNLIGALNGVIPMFPLDGGAILRAYLSMRMNAGRATLIVVGVSQVVAVAMLVVGFVVLGGMNGGMLVMLGAVSLFVFCPMEKARANDGLIYVGEGDAWRSGHNFDFTVPPEKKPGFFQRWREARAQKKAATARKEEEDLRARIDEILVKIKRDGMDALTSQERKLLDRASEHFRQRSGK